MKPPNKAGRPAAEAVERRAEAKENANRCRRGTPAADAHRRIRCRVGVAFLDHVALTSRLARGTFELYRWAERLRDPAATLPASPLTWGKKSMASACRSSRVRRVQRVPLVDHLGRDLALFRHVGRRSDQNPIRRGRERQDVAPGQPANSDFATAETRSLSGKKPSACSRPRTASNCRYSTSPSRAPSARASM
jgi:hypothetical protein